MKYLTLQFDSFIKDGGFLSLILSFLKIVKIILFDSLKNVKSTRVKIKLSLIRPLSILTAFGECLRLIRLYAPSHLQVYKHTRVF